MKRSTFAFLAAAALLALCFASCDNGTTGGGVSGDAAKLQGVWMDANTTAKPSGDVYIASSMIDGATYAFSGNNFSLHLLFSGSYTTGTFQVDEGKLLLIVSGSVVRTFTYGFDEEGLLVLGDDGPSNSGPYYKGNFRKQVHGASDFQGSWVLGDYAKFTFSGNNFEYFSDFGDTTGTFQVRDNILTLNVDGEVARRYVYAFFSDEWIFLDGRVLLPRSEDSIFAGGGAVKVE